MLRCSRLCRANFPRERSIDELVEQQEPHRGDAGFSFGKFHAVLLLGDPLELLGAFGAQVHTGCQRFSA